MTWKKKLRCDRSFGRLSAMKRFLLLLLPVCLSLIACESGPEKVNAELADLRGPAERGDAEAQCELGLEYMRLLNATEANKWFQKSAAQGWPEAQYRLAVNYEKGDGQPKDTIEAYAWFSVAAEQEHLKAMNGRERLMHLLSRGDIEEGNRKAFAYATKNPDRKKLNTKEASDESSKPEKKQKTEAPKF